MANTSDNYLSLSETDRDFDIDVNNKYENDSSWMSNVFKNGIVVDVGLTLKYWLIQSFVVNIIYTMLSLICLN